MINTIKVALVGNPNTGKTSVFNTLTGLNQRVGNYPGITVDRKTGIVKLSSDTKAQVIDLPGTYSLNPTSLDEQVTVDVLLDKENESFPDVVVVVAEAENLKRNLFLFTQIKSLEIPTLLVINMKDQMDKKGIHLDIETIERELKTKVILTSARVNEGFDTLKNEITQYKQLDTTPCVSVLGFEDQFLEENKVASNNFYNTWLQYVKNTKDNNHNKIKKFQHREAISRYQFINNLLKEVYHIDKTKAKDLRTKLDNVFTHKVFGYFIFFGILLLIFQVLFEWSSVPMDFIDESFAFLAEQTKQILPTGLFTDLLSDGIISGIGGVVIFIPQIVFLFLFISILEESGYMSRVVFLMDKSMRKFGLSGKSIVPLISGTACAIPAVMAARNIESWKERLITILVTPFTTCSARLPVYAIIIAIIIPNTDYLGGLLNLRGITLMGLYVLGFIGAISSAYILNKILKIEHKSYFVIEMPDYKVPLVKNVLLNVYEKTKSFVLEAGKIILAISIILWVLASFGPGEEFRNADSIVRMETQGLSEEAIDNEIAAYKLEHSYIGVIGKSIEPVIQPLGYDWKIGIAVVTSFAAREVFIGTLATIYSIGSEEEDTIRNRMEQEIHRESGLPVYTFPVGISILLFYTFAMQCMSTLAIVKRETNGWKWPIIQFTGMTLIAYITALIAFQILK